MTTYYDFRWRTNWELQMMVDAFEHSGTDTPTEEQKLKSAKQELANRRHKQELANRRHIFRQRD